MEAGDRVKEKVATRLTRKQHGTILAIDANGRLMIEWDRLEAEMVSPDEVEVTDEGKVRNAYE